MGVVVQSLNLSLMSPSPVSLAQITPTTFGDLRLANGHSAHRRRIASGSPPSGLQDWLSVFQVRRPVQYPHGIAEPVVQTRPVQEQLTSLKKPQLFRLAQVDMDLKSCAVANCAHHSCQSRLDWYHRTFVMLT